MTEPRRKASEVVLPVVFEFLDHRDYLRAWYQAKKSASRNYSFRILADKAGFASPSFLSEVIQGRRNLSVESAEKCIKALGIGGPAAEYFRVLVSYGQEGAKERREELLRTLLQLQAAQAVQRVTDKQARFYADWVNTAVREAAPLPELRGDAARIGAFLRPPLPAAQVQESLDLLVDLGLLRRDGDGFAHSHPRLTAGNIDPEILRSAKRQLILQALDRLSQGPSHDAHFSTLTLTVSRKRLSKINAALDAFRRELLADTATDEDPMDAVVQLNFQMVPLTRSIADFTRHEKPAGDVLKG